ncbi:twin-arginine translocation signal domain-containing protein [Seonamhaeicola sp.]|uniref:twin-arginine translocation signal domain-containing protein n=1 Tax=Seonamhaeicola sp. TaxID=1912245 RepID=UPI00262053F7|nr:twin-arginine translocation signal domain-containing protein [Seonamhaeicola sp.]
MQQTRRQFIKATSAAGAGLMLSGLPLMAATKPGSGFKLMVFCTKWGFKGGFEAFAKAAKKEGFDGIAVGAPKDEKQREVLFEALDKYNLALGGFSSSGHGNNFQKHLETYANSLDNILAIKPRYVNCHAGKDYFTFEQNKQIFEMGIAKSKQSGIPIYQETHRGRALFAAHLSEDFLNKIPDLRLTLDISHWCNVAESLLDDQKAIVNKVLKRVDHIHARVGFQEGPQVPDFRDPKWKKATEAHFAWWDEVARLKKEANEVLTVTPEFGPTDYMWKMPYTGMPVADQWHINVEMMHAWRKRYL